MSLFLPQVTIVIIDCVAHELTKLAIEDTLSRITPAEMIVFSDTPSVIPSNFNGPVMYQRVQNRTISEAMSVLWYKTPQYLRTSHILTIEYDGWVTNASEWTSEFLQYDYIGAPWPFHADLRVGNGGFSLRSKRLLDFLYVNRVQFPLHETRNEDDLLCRSYRRALEAYGFRWAPEKLAEQFAFECSAPRRTFGFHAMRNFRYVLTPDQLNERRLFATEYVKSKPDWASV